MDTVPHGKLAGIVSSPSLLLRMGLGLTLVYAAARALADPATWVGFVPTWLPLPPALFLSLHAVFELALGIALLFGFRTRLAALLAFLDFTLILLCYGIDEVTFRDFGLLFGALALVALTNEPGN